MADQPEISRYRSRFKQLEDNSFEWRETWREIQRYMNPRKGRYLSGNTNKKKDIGRSEDQRIINNTAGLAADTLSSGMMSGLTSPSRPWFILGLSDEDLMEFEPVKEWLHDVRQILLKVFSGSNFYSSVHSVYKELAVFGVGALFIEEDLTDVIRCRPFTIGEYRLSNGKKNKPDVLYRQFTDTVRNLVHEFGIDNVSESIRTSFKQHSMEADFEIIHAIQPNGDFDPTRRDSRGMSFESKYFERTSSNENKFLRESGYREQPFAIARWNVTGTEAYSDGPGWNALSDTRMLQKMEEEKLKALAKAVSPPLNAPADLKKIGAIVAPNGVNYVDTSKGNPGVTPVYQVNPNLQAMAVELERVEDRINRSFFKDLILGVLEVDKNMTATEVVQRNTEALKILGPVVDRLQSEFLDTIVERVYGISERLGLIPEAPQELAGLDIGIEYISVLAQAQKATGTAAIEQTVQFVGNLSAVFPDVVDKFDADEAVDQFSALVGVPPKLVVPDDRVEAIRAQRAQQAQQAQAQAQLLQMAEGAKTMSETKLGEDNLLATVTEEPV